VPKNQPDFLLKQKKQRSPKGEKKGICFKAIDYLIVSPPPFLLLWDFRSIEFLRPAIKITEFPWRHLARDRGEVDQPRRPWAVGCCRLRRRSGPLEAPDAFLLPR